MPQQTNKRSKCIHVTVKGISLDIPRNAFDDIDMVELVGEVQDGNPFAFPKVIRKLFGEQYGEVKEKLANEAGITTFTAMSEFLAEVMTACNALEAKNS